MPDFRVSTRFGEFTLDELIRKLDRRTRKKRVTKKPQPARKSSTKRQSSYCSCGARTWRIIRDHERYRDPFLLCLGCKQHYRMNRTPLDLTYAWRDGIPMPKEVLEP